MSLVAAGASLAEALRSGNAQAADAALSQWEDAVAEAQADDPDFELPEPQVGPVKRDPADFAQSAEPAEEVVEEDEEPDADSPAPVPVGSAEQDANPAADDPLTPWN